MKGDPIINATQPNILCFPQGDAHGHPVFHPDHAALGPGPDHYGGGLQVLAPGPAEDLLLD